MGLLLLLLRRELKDLLRQRRAFWLLILAVAGTGILPLLLWPGDAASARGESHAGTYLLFFYALLTAALALPAVLGAAMIAGERERGTYELLQAAPVRTAAIIAPKVLACAVYAVVLVLATLPSACMLFFLGGITFGAILKCYAVTLAAGVSSALIGLNASAAASRTTEGVLHALGRVGYWNLPLGFVLLLGMGGSIATSRRKSLVVELDVRSIASAIFRRLWSFLGLLALCLLWVISPGKWGDELFQCTAYTAILAQVHPSSFGADWFWVAYLLYAGFLGLGHLAAVLLGAPPTEDARGRSTRGSFLDKWTNPRNLKIDRSVGSEILVELGKMGTRPLDNPVFFKEVTSELHASMPFRRAVLWCTLGLYFIAWIVTAETGLPWVPLAFCLSTGLALLIAPAVGATAFSREAETGTVDLLRSTPLTSAEILQGKLLAALSSISGVLIVTGGIVMISLLGDWGRVLTGVFAAAAELAAVVFTTVLALAASAVCRRSLSALLFTYAALLGHFLFLPLALNSAFPGSGGAAAVSPFFAFFALAPAVERGHVFTGPLACAVIHAALAVALWLFLRWWLQRQWEREQ